MEGPKSQDKINDAPVFVSGNEKRQQAFPNSKSAKKRERKNPFKKPLAKVKKSSSRALNSTKKFFKDLFSSKRNRIIAISIAAVLVIIAATLIVLSQTIWKAASINDSDYVIEEEGMVDEDGFFARISEETKDMSIEEYKAYLDHILETEKSEQKITDAHLLYAIYLNQKEASTEESFKHIEQINGDNLSCYKKEKYYNELTTIYINRGKYGEQEYYDFIYAAWDDIAKQCSEDI